MWSRSVLLLFYLSLLLLSSCAQRSGQVNSSLKNSSSTAQTYVAIGASDTFGIGASDPYTQNWPTDLANLLGGNLHLVNLGVPGMTVHEALNAELPVATDEHPKLITIWLAVNDLTSGVSIDSYSQDLDTLLTHLQKAAPRARIEVGNVPDLTLLPQLQNSDPTALHQRIDAYNTAINQLVQKHRVILVDMANALQNTAGLISRDGFHPNEAGYLQVAQFFYNALEKAGKTRAVA